jgi:hypothetical protein
MATSKSRIKNAIKKAFDEQAKNVDNPDDPSVSRDKIAEAIADAVIEEIKSMTIKIVGVAGTNTLTITSIIIT